MSNYTTVFTGTDGDKVGSDVVVTQNSILSDLTFSCYYEDDTEYTFSAGDVVTGVFLDKATLTDVYAITGTLTPSAGTNTFTWERAAADTGQPGDYSLAFKVVGGGDPDYSILVSYKITATPDGVLVPAVPLVGVTADDATYLAALSASIPDATDVASAADIADKANKITGGTEDNFTSITAGGDIQDSGSAAADFEIAGAVTAHNTPDGHANDDGATQFGDETTKRNLLHNLSNLPDVTAANITNNDMRGLAFIQTKSHLAGGRLNHYGVYLNNAAQYSLTWGWNCNAVDPTVDGTTDGSGAKGQTLLGYSNHSFSPYTVLQGFQNAALRTGFAIGQYNLIASAVNYLQVHTWTGATDPMSVGISGDLTSTYTADKFVMLFLTSSVGGNTPNVTIDRVVSSSFGGGITTIVLSGRSDFEATIEPGWTDTDGIVQRSFIAEAPTTPGNPTGGAVGRFNYMFKNGYAVGLGNKIYAEGIGIGKQAIVRGDGELAISNGAYSAFGGTRWAQESIYILKAPTVATSAKILTTDSAAAGADNQINIYEKTTYALQISVSASLNDGTAGGGEMIDAIVHRDGSGTVTIVGQTSRYSAFMAGLGAPTIAVTVDATNKAAQVTVTPATTDITYWTATVRATIAGREIPAS